MAVAPKAVSPKAKQFKAGGSSSTLVRENASLAGMKSVSQKYNFAFIPYEKIEVNEMNKKFSQDDAELIMYSILENGLYHPLVAIKDEQKGTYRLISGEQRYHAIGLMDSDTLKQCFPEGIPVNVLKDTKNSVDEKIMIYEANLTARNDSPEDRVAQIRELLDMYQQKQALGEMKNAVQEMVKKFGITERQVRNYVAINRMIPELQQALDENKITMRESAKLAAFSEDAQREIYNILMTAGKVDESEIAAIRKEEEKRKQLELQVAQARKELAERDKTIDALNSRIENIQKESANKAAETREETKENISDTEDLRREVEDLKKMLSNEEAQQKRIRTEYEKLQKEVKEKQERGISLSKEELKKASGIAKAENLYNSIYSMYKEASKLKDVIAEDDTLKTNYKILAGLFQSNFDY